MNYINKGKIMKIIKENKIKKLKRRFNSELSGLVFKDVNQRELKPLKRILDSNKTVYDVIKDLNYYQVVTDFEESELDKFKKILTQFENETGYILYDFFINKKY